jgi:hypothetical protein
MTSFPKMLNFKNAMYCSCESVLLSSHHPCPRGHLQYQAASAHHQAIPVAFGNVCSSPNGVCTVSEMASCVMNDPTQTGKDCKTSFIRQQRKPQRDGTRWCTMIGICPCWIAGIAQSCLFSSDLHFWAVVDENDDRCPWYIITTKGRATVHVC